MTTMKLDDRDIICEQDYTTLSNAELVAHIETYARLMHSTPLSAAEWLDDIIGPARVLLARAEAAEAREHASMAVIDNLRDKLADSERTNAALAARVAELEAELASDDADENQWLDAYIESAAKDGATIKRLMARVAELEAALAAQQWRPGSETPAPDWYQTAETIDGVFSHAYFDGAVWQGYPDDYPPMWYRPIPPLPQEPTP